MIFKKAKIISKIKVILLIICCGNIFYAPLIEAQKIKEKSIAVSKYHITENSRPVLPDSFLSSERHFNIHYITRGKDSVSITDSNADYIPDRIEKIACAFEKSYSVECEQMRYPLPPSMNNGSSPYDIYVIDLGNQYAVTKKYGFDSTLTVLKNVHSYILFDNDFIGQGFHIHGENAIKVTAAHEFFHAIQLGYVFRNTDGFFFELTAVWIEDQVFDEVDNYLYFLDYFFSAPDIPLNGVSYTIPGVFKHIYGSCIFGFYIAENFGNEAIRQIWQLMPEKTAIEAMDQVFKDHGSNFEKEFVKFCEWNFFTGKRALTNYSYKEASKYPEVRLEKDEIIEYYFEENNKGYFLTSAYFILRPLKDGIYRVNFSTKFMDHWRLGLIIWNDDTIKTFSILPGETLTLEPIHQGQKIVAIPCNIDRFANPTKIYFKEDPEEYTFILNKERTVNKGIVKSFQIQNVYPNPFSGSITFNIKKISDSNIMLKMFNIEGQLIDRIKIGELSQNLTQVNWDVSSSQTMLTSGLYFFQFSDGDFSETKKVVLCW